MSIYSNIKMYMETAKRGTWQKAGDAVRALATIHLTAPSTTYDGNGNPSTVTTSFNCDFSCLTDGAFFIKKDGIGTGYELLLVAPDDSIDFNGLASMTLSDAMDYLSTYTSTSPVPGWNDFLTWFNNKWRTFGSYSSIITAKIVGQTVSTLPSYSATNTSQSVWFSWLKQTADNSAAKSILLGTMKSGNKYTVPVTISAGGITANMEFVLCI